MSLSMRLLKSGEKKRVLLSGYCRANMVDNRLTCKAFRVMNVLRKAGVDNENKRMDY